MSLTRRQMLHGSAAFAAALAAPVASAEAASAATPGPGATVDRGVQVATSPARTTAPASRFRDPLPIPAVLDGRHPITLTARNVTHRFSSAAGPAPALAYTVTSGQVLSPGSHWAGTGLGPTISVPMGRRSQITLVNALGPHPLAASIDPELHGTEATDAGAPRIAMHLHGGNTAEVHDGGPHDTFRPGTRRTYRYDNTQDATALWYHDHAVGITRLNVHAGLAGLYLLRDNLLSGIDRGDGVHLPAGEHEIPLVIQDRAFTATGALAYPPAPWGSEFFGDTPVVNGVAFPYHQVGRGIYRLRLANGSNARFYRLRLVPRSGEPLPLAVIGTDGGLLNTPTTIEALLIAPGERVDVLVDFRSLAPGEEVVMTNDAAAPFPTQASDAPLIPQIMAFRVTAASGWALPGLSAAATATRISGASLRPTRRVTDLRRYAGKAAAVRRHSLVEITDANDEVMMVTLDNRMFDSTEYQQQPSRAGTLELWEFVNTTNDTHPIHLHLVQFQLYDRQALDGAAYRKAHYEGPDGLVTLGSGPYPAPAPGSYLQGAPIAPAAFESGWKDTVSAPPNMVTRILVPFGALPGVRVASPVGHRGDYVWHCHILEHEDHDMMQSVRVI